MRKIKRKFKKNNRERDFFQKFINFFLVFFAIILSTGSLFLLLKNFNFDELLAKEDDNIYIEDVENNKVLKIDENKKLYKSFPIKKRESFLLNPPEIEKIEEDLQEQQRYLKLNKKILNIYFIRVTDEGYLYVSPIKRAVYYEKNILSETIKELIKGPDEIELKNNYLSLIPSNTELLDAKVENKVAYLNFNQNFYYNTFGIEGTIKQLKQIVYTVEQIPGIESVKLSVDKKPIKIKELNLDFSNELKRSILEKF